LPDLAQPTELLEPFEQQACGQWREPLAWKLDVSTDCQLARALQVKSVRLHGGKKNSFTLGVMQLYSDVLNMLEPLTGTPK
jgi:hypothetical protein